MTATFEQLVRFSHAFVASTSWSLLSRRLYW